MYLSCSDLRLINLAGLLGHQSLVLVEWPPSRSSHGASPNPEI